MKSQKIGIRSDDSHTSSLERFVVGLSGNDDQTKGVTTTKNTVADSTNITLEK